MCTVFLAKDVSVIAPFVKRFKVASLEAMDLEFIRAHSRFKKRIVISTGALTYELMEGLRDRAWGYGEDPCWTDKCHDVKFLQCTAAYPAPLDAINLAPLKHFRFNGLSDHSGDVLTGALAVACGADIIEVHMRLDETRKDNPDFPHSHGPSELRTYIANIRKAELMLGDEVKKIEDCERAMVKHRVGI